MVDLLGHGGKQLINTLRKKTVKENIWSFSGLILVEGKFLKHTPKHRSASKLPHRHNNKYYHPPDCQAYQNPVSKPSMSTIKIQVPIHTPSRITRTTPIFQISPVPVASAFLTGPPLRLTPGYRNPPPIKS